MMQNKKKINAADREIEQVLLNINNTILIILFLIIFTYEISTQAFFKNFSPKEKIEAELFIKPQIFYNETKAEQHKCDRKVKLAAYDHFPVVYLNSFPGSGNTWSRQLIKDITGYYSGSIYNEGTMVKGGFKGEYDDPSSGRTVVVKNHGQNKMEFAKGIILIVRNPYNAIVADFNRQFGGGHTGSAGNHFDGPEWPQFIDHHLERWQDSHFWYPIYAKLAKIPLMVIYYEDLKEDVIPQMNRVHKFYEDHFNITFDDRKLRLGCLVEHQANFFRKKQLLTKELFPDEAIKRGDVIIRTLQVFFELYGLNTISDDYYKGKDGRQGVRDVSCEEVREYADGSQVAGKVRQTLSAKDIYEDQKIHQYYSFSGFKKNRDF